MSINLFKIILELLTMTGGSYRKEVLPAPIAQQIGDEAIVMTLNYSHYLIRFFKLRYIFAFRFDHKLIELFKYSLKD